VSRMDEILENAAIDAWAGAFRRAPSRANAPHESDAELLEIESLPDRYLAITIDTVAEEIATGLYRDPFTMGWVTVMASLSDLAAVGADPVGVVVSVSAPPGRDAGFVDGARRGMEEACCSVGTFVLGGDLSLCFYDFARLIFAGPAKNLDVVGFARRGARIPVEKRRMR